MLYQDHQKEVSPLIDSKVSLVAGFVLDYMHLICQGVVKQLISYWRKGPKGKQSYAILSRISEKPISFRSMLSEFVRQPRTLFEVDRWKATEFRQFLLYTGPVVLGDILPCDLCTHFVALSIAVNIFLIEDSVKRDH